MTAKEAIRILETAKAEIEWSAPLEYQEAFDRAIEALEKQIPMPTKEELDISGRRIRVCGYCGDVPRNGKFCKLCGQRIER